MKKEKKSEQVNGDLDVKQEEIQQSEDKKDSTDEQIEAMKIQLEDKTKKCEEYLNALQRSAAEFENYKKRTVKEKDNLSSEVVSDVVTAFLPIVDNMERAIQAFGKEEDKKPLLEGIDMVFRQFKDVLKSLGVEEIKCIGEKFDPQLHNAVMHIEDENEGENVVVEEFQKGYIIKEKVVRHSMVKVAN